MYAQRLISMVTINTRLYCWGQQGSPGTERTCKIQVDGQDFMVSPIVLDLLIRLHNTETDRTLWIDLICIDQESNAEKGFQVNRMRDIFKQADRVVASLGPHKNQRSLGLESFTNKAWGLVTNNTSHQLQALLESRTMSSFRRFRSQPDQLEERRIRRFLQHPWFERV